jgi:hypothetical protein
MACYNLQFVMAAMIAVMSFGPHQDQIDLDSLSSSHSRLCLQNIFHKSLRRQKVFFTGA